MEAVAMAFLWSLHLLAFLFSANSVHSHNTLPGLSCVNDFVNNISCTWSGSQADPGADCWLLGTKQYYQYTTDSTRHIKRNCKLQMQDRVGDSVRSCSFVFEKKSHVPAFTFYESMPSIEVQCNNLTVDKLTDYMPEEHIKMHPPSSPNISSGVNETWIGWDPGDPRSPLIDRFHFEIQIKHHHQAWEDVHPLPTPERALKIPAEEEAAGRLAGLYQVRVRVKPEHVGTAMNSYWSDWSATASWETPPAQERRGVAWSRGGHGKYIVPAGDVVSWLLPAGLSFCTVFTVTLIVLCKARSNQGLCKGTPVPDPSKYFHTVHQGNFKEWLNPQTAPECYFFTVQSCDHISSVVEVSDDLVSSSTPCLLSPPTSVTATLHPRPLSGPSSGGGGMCIGGASGVVNVSSSSSSSCLSNVVLHNKDYFFSPSSDLCLGPAPSSDPCPGPALSSDLCLGPAPSSDPCPGPAPSSDLCLGPAPSSDLCLGPAPSSDPCPGPAPSSDLCLGLAPSSDPCPGPASCPVYFTYQDDFLLTPHSAVKVHTFRLTRCPSPSPALSSSSPYELLLRRATAPPQSPDSGFGSTEDQADDEEEEEEEADDYDGVEFSDDPQEEEESGCGPLILPLHLRSSLLSSPCPPPPPPIPSPIAPQPPPKLQATPPLVQVGGGGGGCSYVAWPPALGNAAGSWGSSVSVEHLHGTTGGYLTLKDLHNTYRNKSI